MALGATSPGIVRLICAEALRWIAAGVTCGVLGTLVLSRIGGAVVFGSTNRQQPNGNLLLGPQHPAALVAAVAAIILGIGLIAAYGPARHASRLDPLVALRSGNE
jgi:ABC-type antimicrobial peptide transport system permease subunit